MKCNYFIRLAIQYNNFLYVRLTNKRHTHTQTNKILNLRIPKEKKKEKTEKAKMKKNSLLDLIYGSVQFGLLSHSNIKMGGLHVMHVHYTTFMLSSHVHNETHVEALHIYG